VRDGADVGKARLPAGHVVGMRPAVAVLAPVDDDARTVGQRIGRYVVRTAAWVVAAPAVAGLSARSADAIIGALAPIAALVGVIVRGGGACTRDEWARRGENEATEGAHHSGSEGAPRPDRVNLGALRQTRSR
jgi:hypothetical protein